MAAKQPLERLAGLQCLNFVKYSPCLRGPGRLIRNTIKLEKFAFGGFLCWWVYGGFDIPVVSMGVAISKSEVSLRRKCKTKEEDGANLE